jgi:hypothetical protein
VEDDLPRTRSLGTNEALATSTIFAEKQEITSTLLLASPRVNESRPLAALRVYVAAQLTLDKDGNVAGDGDMRARIEQVAKISKPASRPSKPMRPTSS